MNIDLIHKINNLSRLESDIPFFVIDLKKLQSFVKDLQNEAPKNVKFIFPIKSLPDIPFLKCINAVMDGFEFSNFDEFRLMQFHFAG